MSPLTCCWKNSWRRRPCLSFQDSHHSPHGWFGQGTFREGPIRSPGHLYPGPGEGAGKVPEKRVEEIRPEHYPPIIVVSRYIPHADGTSCNIRKEKIHGTDNGWILRVPFKDREHKIVDHWISPLSCVGQTWSSLRGLCHRHYNLGVSRTPGSHNRQLFRRQPGGFASFG
jgi:hypothetical protein